MTPAELEVKKSIYTDSAKRTFNADSGASIDTHIAHHLQRLIRDTHNASSTLKSSDSVGYDISKVKRAADEYYMTYGKDAPIEHIAKSTGLSKKVVQKHLNSQGPTVSFSSDFSVSSIDISPEDFFQPKSKEDKKVFDTIVNDMSSSESLKHTGLSKSSYYRSLDRIKKAMRKTYLNKVEAWSQK